MLKLCSCFRGNSDDHKQIKKIKNIKSNNKENITDFSFFLVGDDESGKTKIIEELVDEEYPFTREEKILKISEIEHYIRDSLTNLLRAFNQSNPPIQLEYPESQQCMTYILTTAHKTDFEYPIKFFEFVEILWTDAGLQTFLETSYTYRLSDSAKYFLDRVSQIRDPDYLPTTKDMIYSRFSSSKIFKKSFEIKTERVRLNILEMNVSNDNEQELIQSSFNKTNIIIFITDCSCFDVMINEDISQTQLHQSINLYKMIQNNKLFESTPVILLLNKQDLLERKIKDGVRLEDYFPDFEEYVFSGDVNSDEDPEVARAKHFIEHQFLSNNLNKCYRHFTCDNDLTVPLILSDTKHSMLEQII